MRVLVLAQNPKTERNVEEPLEGTRSGRTVKVWLKAMGDPDVVVLNASRKTGKVCWRDYDLVTVAAVAPQCTRFIALGAYAAGLFDRLGIRYFALPHPSGLCRKNNDARELAHQLALCRIYLGT